MTIAQNSHSLELQQWATALEAEIEQIKSGIAPLEQRLAAARERLDLIKRLIRLTEGAEPPQQRATGARTASSQSTPTPPSVGKQDLEGQIAQILGEAGKPMHISNVRQALVDRAVPLPGRGDEANIIVRLRRAPDRFTRTGRGTYALATLGLDAVPPSKRKRTLRAGRKA